MEIDFILYEMTALKYFIPIVFEANKIGISCNFFCNSNHEKYNSLKLNKRNLRNYAKKFKINCMRFKDLKNRLNPIITIEGVGLDDFRKTNEKQKIYSINYCGDFVNLYDLYKDRVDAILMISEYFANYYDCQNKKNLYLGSPKFDCILNKKEILKKYKLNSQEKYVLILYPKKRDIKKIKIRMIYRILKELGFKIIIKTRGKDPVYNFFNRGDYYFEDKSWYPHITMELINISEVVINFGSSAIEETVLLNTPIIDFNIKPFEKLFKPLYDFKFAFNFEPEFEKNNLKNAINYLLNTDLTNEFKIAQKEMLFENDFNSSKKLLNFIIKDN